MKWTWTHIYLQSRPGCLAYETMSWNDACPLVFHVHCHQLIIHGVLSVQGLLINARSNRNQEVKWSMWDVRRHGKSKVTLSFMCISIGLTLRQNCLINSSTSAYCLICRIIDLKILDADTSVAWSWCWSLVFPVVITMFCCIYFSWFWDLISCACAVTKAVIISSSFNTPPTLKKPPQKLNATTPNQTNLSTKTPPTLHQNIMGRFLYLRTSFFCLSGKMPVRHFTDNPYFLWAV